MSVFLVVAQTSTCGLPPFQLTADLLMEECPFPPGGIPCVDGGRPAMFCNLKTPSEQLAEIQKDFGADSYALDTVYSDDKCETLAFLRATRYDGSCNNIGTSSSTTIVKGNEIVNTVYSDIDCKGEGDSNVSAIPPVGCFPNPNANLGEAPYRKQQVFLVTAPPPPPPPPTSTVKTIQPKPTNETKPPKPTDTTEPSKPTDKTEPSKPTDKTEPPKVTDKTEPPKLTEPTYPGSNPPPYAAPVEPYQEDPVVADEDPIAAYEDPVVTPEDCSDEQNAEQNVDQIAEDPVVTPEDCSDEEKNVEQNVDQIAELGEQEGEKNVFNEEEDADAVKKTLNATSGGFIVKAGLIAIGSFLLLL